MNIYVISLTDASERRAHIRQEFAKHGVSFEFFDAITKQQVAKQATSLGVDLSHSPSMSEGEQACLLSHLTLWQRAIEDNTYIAVFEDDVHLGADAGHFLTDVNWLPPACEYLKLEHFMDSLHLGGSIAQHKKRDIKPLKECNWGTAGYIISPQVARQLTAITQTQCAKEGLPIDHIMFDVAQKQLSIYQLTPALCIQSDRLLPTTDLPSTLETQRQLALKNLKKTKSKKSLGEKLTKELTRPFKRAKQQLTKHLRQPVSFQ